MKRYVLAAALALGLGGAHAAAIDLAAGNPSGHQIRQAVTFRVPDLAVTPGVSTVLPAGLMSELPEPEVFLMMLVGLVLIGYRASRDSNDKFK